MTRVKGLLILAVLGLALAGVVAAAQQPAATSAQDQYVPVKDLPADAVEALPAAPFVVGAYAFVWAALIVYVWSVWRRLGKVQAEIADLQRRIAASSRR